MTKKKLFLLDAYALIYRAYFAFIKNPRINSKGVDTSAIFGFANTILDLIKREKPTHLAVVFDTPKPTERHIIFPEYKAHRESTPDAIIDAELYIEDFLKAMRIPKLFKDGFEADDVIGTLAKKAEKEGFEVYMMTSDKDFAQLVSENIFMYRPGSKWKPTEVWGVKEVLEKFQIKKVEQVIDFLGMMGDSADNIPGLPGVGEKTAQKFIMKYGSMESLIDNIDEIPGKLKDKIKKSKEKGIISKKLATIITNVPIDFDEHQMKMSNVDLDSLKKLFVELEFKRILERFIQTAELKLDSKKNNDTQGFSFSNGQLDIFDQKEKIVKSKELNISRNYTTILSEKEVDELKQKIKKNKICAFCILYDDELIGISISFAKNNSQYITVKNINQHVILEFLNEIFSDNTIQKIGFDIKFQIKKMQNFKTEFPQNIMDILIAHYLLHPELRHSFDILAANYLNEECFDIDAALGKGKNKKRISDLSMQQQEFYACESSDFSFQIAQFLQKDLKELNLSQLFFNIEMPLLPVLLKMEVAGIKLDIKMLANYSQELLQNIDKIQDNIFKYSGKKFNVSSPKQLGEILFDKMKISSNIKKTKLGQHSTSEDVLIQLKGDHPIIESILEYRELKKLLSTYVESLPKLVHTCSGRIHTTFNQSVASTGRLSSQNPNLQNIPIRTARGRKIRSSFIPENNDFLLLSADYSQIELRIMAHLSGDRFMKELFDQNLDIHTATAAKVYNKDPEDVTREMRSNAKMVNFGIIYGISAFGLSQRLGIKRSEASLIIKEYFIQFPKIKEYIDRIILEAREKEYVETIMGRKKYLKDINSRNATLRGFAERNAVNAPIQGSAADIIKKAMIEIQQELENKKFKSRMLLQVHDELVFEMPIKERESLIKLTKEKMEKTISLRVPLEVNIGIGKNWLESH